VTRLASACVVLSCLTLSSPALPFVGASPATSATTSCPDYHRLSERAPQADAGTVARIARRLISRRLARSLTPPINHPHLQSVEHLRTSAARIRSAALAHCAVRTRPWVEASSWSVVANFPLNTTTYPPFIAFVLSESARTDRWFIWATVKLP
jgi:hypothetical protein